MARVWDILPPKKRKLTKFERKEEKRRRKIGPWLFFILMVGAIIFIASASGNFVPPISSTSNPVPANSSPTVETVPTTKTKQNISIKILNGTGRFEETDRIKKIVSDLGYEVKTTESALNLYDQTTVYYQLPSEEFATEITDGLKDFKAKSQKFTQETKYDIVIVIGSN
ncbi:MAG: hypothetical protein UT15_C0003G0036 [Berkelbacteria bacterium GW2011_GWA1_39_10]|uniref:LytR/CpsA/Psr regulator C-terminal domain-containing protein n=1 Tax=Berkelbacteria bacterium GW2011_GWA1_39_10 TaxID=1618332 RepID=A0A0G0PNG4_9BACT|nr:MAG: hypothetical protein UT15_C0003G0036 [Berkelbacteria bacterium GW2011_GWA1_39_10]